MSIGSGLWQVFFMERKQCRSWINDFGDGSENTLLPNLKHTAYLK